MWLGTGHSSNEIHWCRVVRPDSSTRTKHPRALDDRGLHSLNYVPCVKLLWTGELKQWSSSLTTACIEYVPFLACLVCPPKSVPLRKSTPCFVRPTHAHTDGEAFAMGVAAFWHMGNYRDYKFAQMCTIDGMHQPELRALPALRS